MVRAAFDRVAVGPAALVAPEDFYVVTGADFREGMWHHLPEVPKVNILVEPERRNTLPAILWAVCNISRPEDEYTFLVLTADHFIPEKAEFCQCLSLAVEKANEQRDVVTIGIAPSDDAAEWLSFGAMKAETSKATSLVLERFEEKPALVRAQEMLAQGGWFWNAGMFVFRHSTLRMALELLSPAIFSIFSGMAAEIVAGNISAAADLFKTFNPKIPHPLEEPKRYVDCSIDYALMVPLALKQETLPVGARLVPGTFRWADIGSWAALPTVLEPNQGTNVVIGQGVVLDDCEECVVFREPGYSDYWKLKVVGGRGHVIVWGKQMPVLVLTTIASAARVKELYSRYPSEIDPMCVDGAVQVVSEFIDWPFQIMSADVKAKVCDSESDMMEVTFKVEFTE